MANKFTFDEDNSNNRHYSSPRVTDESEKATPFEVSWASFGDDENNKDDSFRPAAPEHQEREQAPQEEANENKSETPSKEPEIKKEKKTEKKPKKRSSGKKIKAKQNKALGVVLIVFIVAVIVFAFIVAGNGYDNPCETEYVKNGTIEFVQDATALFCREEKTVVAPADGKVVPVIKEGERVAAGAVICYVATEEDSSMLVEKLDLIESRISVLEKVGSNVFSQSEADVDLLTRKQDELCKKMAEMSSGASFDEYEELSNSLRLVSEEKKELLMTNDGSDSYLEQLVSQRNAVKAELEKKSVPVFANEAGTVSFWLDGNEARSTEIESSLSIDINYAGLSYSDVVSQKDEMINRQHQQVKKGTEIVKLITNQNYYIAVAIPEGGGAPQGTDVSLKASDGAFNISAELVSTLPQLSGTVFVYKTSKGLVSSLSHRVSDIKLVTGTFTGLKVLKSSLCDFDSAGLNARISLVRANFVEHCYVRIVAADELYAIITNGSFDDAEVINEENENGSVKAVKVNDVYLKNPNAVNEGEQIQ